MASLTGHRARRPTSDPAQAPRACPRGPQWRRWLKRARGGIVLLWNVEMLTGDAGFVLCLRRKSSSRRQSQVKPRASSLLYVENRRSGAYFRNTRRKTWTLLCMRTKPGQQRQVTDDNDDIPAFQQFFNKQFRSSQQPPERNDKSPPRKSAGTAAGAANTRSSLACRMHSVQIPDSSVCHVSDRNRANAQRAKRKAQMTFLHR